MADRVYIETTIVSYLTAWPSRNLIGAAQQQITRDWWRDAAQRFELVTSELVMIEASTGDATVAAERMAKLRPLINLDATEAAVRLGQSLVDGGAIPVKASRDAIHVGICATNGIPYLLTWNFRHLANATMKDRIDEVCEAQGFRPPVICTPEELFED
jgi:hypothetical protein